MKLKKMVGEDESLTSKSKVDLSKLPPCRSSLHPHIQRVNFRVAQWKRSHIPIYEMPDPLEHGWVKNDEQLEPKWSVGDIMPQSLVDIIPDATELDEPEEDQLSDIEDIVTNIYSESDDD